MRKSKFISLFLVAVMVVSCFVAAGITTSAASENVVYFDNSVTGFSSVSCYLWKDGEDKTLESMTNTSDDIWSLSVTEAYDKLIFTDGNLQSVELDFPQSDMIAKAKTLEDGFEVSWAAYQPVEETTAKAATDKKSKAKTGASGGTVYCLNAAGWSTVNCYMWKGNGGSGNENSGWPGVKMTNIGDNVWEYNYNDDYTKIIFNDGGTQTGDLDFPGNGKIYNNSTGSWEDYSSSPVKITSFSTGIESPSYTNVSVLISAEAKSSEGALTYKFSVTSSNGTTQVIGSGSSSTAAWIPTQTGTYTITVDVTDTAGNNNSRSIKNFEIKDASTLETAFISAFTNSLKTNKTILQNSSVTFTTGALGGKVGTNLLFYKFAVTEPDGTNRLAYYTTGNTYTFTPTKLGTYTINAYVQNSHNDTVSKTYTYNCATSIPTDDKADGTNIPTVNPNPQPSTGTPTPTVTNDPTPIVTVPDAKLGDVNRDGTISIKDVTLIQKHLANLTVLDSEQNKLADVNKDGYVSIKDASTIQKYIAKIITSFD